jgi:hypothetical protein
MLDVDTFKGIFNVRKRSAAEKFNRRETKVDLALTQMMKFVEELDELKVNTSRFYKVYKKLSAKVEEAERIGQTDPQKAYDMLDDVKQKAREQAAAAQRECHDQKYAADTKVEVEGLGEVQLHPQAIPGCDELSKKDRKRLAEAMGRKVGDGKKLYEDLISGNVSSEPDRKAIADLMWYIRVMAEDKAGEAFAKGAVTIPDPGGHLRTFFDKVEEVYRRDSSHLKEEQGKFHGQARGIDFYEGGLDNPDILLPYGMTTVLTQTANSGQGNMLYVKMETEGARVNPFRSDKGHEESPENRDWKMVDVKRSVLHLINLLKSHEDGSLASFREQTPAEITQAYAKALAKASEVKDKEIKSVLKRGHKFARKLVTRKKKSDQGNSIRIHTIANNIEDIRDLIDSRLNSDVATDEGLIDALNECIELIIDRFGDDLRELGNRFGGEIQLNPEDMTRTNQEPQKIDEDVEDSEIELEDSVDESEQSINEVEENLDEFDYELQSLESALQNLTRNYR